MTRRPSVPSWSSPTAVATSRTTAPASSSAIRSCRSPSGGRASATSSRTCARSKPCCRRARRLRHRGDRGPPATRASGSATRRSRRSAYASPRAHAARLRAQCRSRPRDVRATSSRAASPTAGHVDGAAARSTGRRCVRSSIVSSRGSPRRSGSRPSTVKTSPGRPRRSPSRPTAARRSCHRCGCWAGSRPRESTADPEVGARPEWMSVRARFDDDYLELKKLVRGLDLHTVCEEAGCPNIYECWADRTATFMILGDRCTRACGFCLVDTRKPLAVDVDEPRRVAEAVVALGLAHAVVTCVARDDLPDGGASVFAADRRTRSGASARRPRCRAADLRLQGRRRRRSRRSSTRRPDVLNHNLETVARLQRAARPSAGYARSLSVLARAKAAGLTTKSGLILGMGETVDEVRAALRRPARGRRRHRHARPVPAAVGAPSPGREVVDARRVRRGARRTPRRSASRTSRPGRSCGPATTPAPESIGGPRRSPDMTGAMAETLSDPSRRDLADGGPAQPLFFVATAPSGERRPRQLSPKGSTRFASSARTGSPIST